MADLLAAPPHSGAWEHEQMLLVEDVHKAYGPTPVLTGIYLRLNPAEVLGLVGGNGVGKTTLLRLVATLGTPDRGRISVAGHDTASQADAVRRHLGVLFHQTHLYEDLTPEENLSFWGTMRGHRVDAEALTATFMQLGLMPYRHQRVRTLSHGTKKRIALARLMLGQASLLLLDEPYSGLDARAAETHDAYLTAHRQRGGSALLVSHDLVALHRVCDRLALLASGRLTLSVATDDISVPQLQAALGAAKVKEGR